MSSDEDFSLVTEQSQSLSSVQTEISKYKKEHQDLLEEQNELNKNIKLRQNLTEQFRQRSAKLNENLKEDEHSHQLQLEQEMKKCEQLKKEQQELMEEIQNIRAAMVEEEEGITHLRQQTDVFSAVPERKLVFKGETGNANNAQRFDMDPLIEYPMEGGTALVTFEEEHVVKKILTKKTHQVDLGSECSIRVEARPVHLMLPRLVEIDTAVCPWRVLVSNLPKMDVDILMDKLQIYFSKSRHGGGEVEDCEFLSDSGTVVLTFIQDNVAQRLTDTEFHEITLQQKKHQVRVTPFINGKITDFKTMMRPCPRTVLLTGIPDVMERETLQDLLEIHFQKSSNSGGEIEAFLYNPVGGHAIAVFRGVSEEVAAAAEEDK
ncbi:interferon-induced 35 kDa protein [Pholidichthys leucotaenia]